jgi:hypothetical protein
MEVIHDIRAMRVWLTSDEARSTKGWICIPAPSPIPPSASRSDLPTSANQLSIGSRSQLPRFISFSQKRMASAPQPWALVPVPSPKPWPRFPNL